MPSAIVYEDDDFMAILDLYPVSEGHTLLIPKYHHTNIFEAPNEIMPKIYPLLKKVSNAVTAVTGCDGINIVQNNGVAAQQVVFHAHIHVVPRFTDDAIKVAIAGKTKATDEALERLSSKLAAAFSKLN
jgi:histidine triad (HIT) family protein